MAGLFSMMVFRLPLWMNKKIVFWKLMGTAQSGAFDLRPDWRQWVIFTVDREEETPDKITKPIDYKEYYGRFMSGWWTFFNCELYSIRLRPLAGHGSWDDQQLFTGITTQAADGGVVAVLTRATIRLRRLRRFWGQVESITGELKASKGLLLSLGVSEMPVIKQGTFSIWESAADMEQFAYRMPKHKEVIGNTRKEKWYKEELFMRFRPVATFGSIGGHDPLEGKL